MRYRITSHITNDLNTILDYETLFTQINLSTGYGGATAGGAQFQMKTMNSQLFMSTLESTIIPAQYTAAELSQTHDNAKDHTLLDCLAEEITQAVLIALT